MRERKCVKFKLDIYDDTKTKIIDQRAERDFIHYYFARCIVLAGKADCEGNLYMAKDIPYTIETLAIEFNRDAALVKVALDVLIDLKMITVIEENIYRVKSFVKHQNIKVKEKVEMNEKSEKNTVAASNVGESANKEVEIKEDKKAEGDKIGKTEEGSSRDSIINAAVTGITNDLENVDTKKNNLVALEVKDNKKTNKIKKSNLVTELAVDEMEDDSQIFSFTNGDMPPLGEGERLVWALTPV